MGLIICPDCGKQVSDQIDACIHCGAPLKKKQSYIVEFTAKASWNKLKKFEYTLMKEPTGKVLGSVKGGEKISLELKDAIKIRCHMEKSLGIKDAVFEYIPGDFKKYEISYSQGLVLAQVTVKPIE